MTISYGFNAYVHTIRFNDDWSERFTTLTNTQVVVTAPDGDPGFTIDEWGYAGFDQLSDSAIRYSTPTYGSVADTLSPENPTSLRRVVQPGGEVTYLLVIDRHVRTADDRVIGFDDIYFYVSGAPLPAFASNTEFEAWYEASSWGTIDPADYPADTLIVWDDFDIDPVFTGTAQNETLTGTEFSDLISGGDGADTLIGAESNDTIRGGDTSADLRDVIYGGDGNDSIDGGYGNDNIRGDGGNDIIEGGFGADTLIGGFGNDTLSGSALSDQIFGGDGNDYLNGGFGNDRLNGGAGADKFYHLGVAGHGSDWVQDYHGAENDVLLFGNASATRSQFQINWATTAGAGVADVQEAFVVYRPTGQILWALVDGAANDHIWLQIGANTYDLLA